MTPALTTRTTSGAAWEDSLTAAPAPAGSGGFVAQLLQRLTRRKNESTADAIGRLVDGHIQEDRDLAAEAAKLQADLGGDGALVAQALGGRDGQAVAAMQHRLTQITDRRTALSTVLLHLQDAQNVALFKDADASAAARTPAYRAALIRFEAALVEADDAFQEVAAIADGLVDRWLECDHRVALVTENARPLLRRTARVPEATAVSAAWRVWFGRSGGPSRFDRWRKELSDYLDQAPKE